MESVKVSYQEKKFRGEFTDVVVRYDDRHRNGHNTFSITGECFAGPNKDSCGCIHGIIHDEFPELRHLIKWHLMSSDRPMHYIANTLYHSNETKYVCPNHWVYFVDEELKIRECLRYTTLDDQWYIKLVERYGDRIQVKRDADKDKDPKANLEAARSCAIWPDATLEQLQDVDALKARLPALIAEFKSVIEAEPLGFIF